MSAKKSTKVFMWNVGRSKWMGRFGVPHGGNVAQEIERVARKHLLSKEIRLAYDEGDKSGEIIAGFTTVGYFRIL